ncbi:MAG: hypothetical protein J0H02_13910 [Armatimonadetes bacterium]|nr:hypothetical protein [Armatimonadota bacterium]
MRRHLYSIGYHIGAGSLQRLLLSQAEPHCRSTYCAVDRVVVDLTLWQGFALHVGRYLFSSSNPLIE